MAAYALVLTMLVVAVRARTSPDGSIRAGASLAFGLTLSQIVLGCAMCSSAPALALGGTSGDRDRDPGPDGHDHLAGGEGRSALARAPGGGGGAMSLAMPQVTVRRQALAYLELTKPRIVSLVVLTGVPALLIAAHGFPPARVFFGTLLGTVLAAASAASFNMYFDHDIDALMRRTATRPLPAGVLLPSSALGLGFVLAGLAWMVLLLAGNLLAAVIGIASIFYYAVVYTVC